MRYKYISRFMASFTALFVFLMIWSLYYVGFSIWGKEAFVIFVTGLGKSPLVRAFYALFLLSALMNIIRAARHRLALGRAGALWLVLPAGLWMFMAGFFLSASFRQAGTVIAAVGDGIIPPWQETRYEITNVSLPLQDEMVETSAGLGTFKFEPKVKIKNSRGQFTVGAFPPALIDGNYFHVLNFGIAPGIRLKADGVVMEEGYVPLNLLPPGVKDEFRPGRYPYDVEIRLLPSGTINVQGTSRRKYDFNNPVYGVNIMRAGKTLFEGDSQSPILFEGFELSFFAPDRFVLLEAAKDPGRRLIIFGFLIACAGIPCYAAYRVLIVKSVKKES